MTVISPDWVGQKNVLNSRRKASKSIAPVPVTGREFWERQRRCHHGICFWKLSAPITP